MCTKRYRAREDIPIAASTPAQLTKDSQLAIRPQRRVQAKDSPCKLTNVSADNLSSAFSLEQASTFRNISFSLSITALVS